MTKPHDIHWDNIGITIGVSVYELCDICKKDCSSKIIRSTIERLYIIKCSALECKEKHKEGLQTINDEFITKHKESTLEER